MRFLENSQNLFRKELFFCFGQAKNNTFVQWKRQLI
jgi:hypothetical protein